MSNFVAVIIVKTPFFSRFVPDAYSIKKRCKLGSLASSLGSVKAGVKVAVTLCSMKPKIKRKVFEVTRPTSITMLNCPRQSVGL